jgi:hypothetical protein
MCLTVLGGATLARGGEVTGDKAGSGSKGSRAARATQGR